MDGAPRKRKKWSFSIKCLLSKKEIERLIDRHTVQIYHKTGPITDSPLPKILSTSHNSTITTKNPTTPVSSPRPRPSPLSLASFHPPPQSRSIVSSRSSSCSSSPSIPSHLAPKPLLIPALSSLPTSSLSTNHTFQSINNGRSNSRSRFRRSPTPGPWGKMLSNKNGKKVKDEVDVEEIDTWVIADVIDISSVSPPRIKLKRVSKTNSRSPSSSPPKPPRIFVTSPKKIKRDEVDLEEREVIEIDQEERVVFEEDFDGSLVCLTSQSGSSTPPLLVPFSPSPPPSPSSSSLSSSPLPSFSRFLYSPAVDSPCPSLPSPCPQSIHDKDKLVTIPDTHLKLQKNDKIKVPPPPLKYDAISINGTAASSDCSSSSPPITRLTTTRINNANHTTETAKDERVSRSITPTPVLSLQSVITRAPLDSFYYKNLLFWQDSLNSACNSEAPIFVENLYDNEPPPVNFKYITSSIYSTNVPTPNITALVGCNCLNCSESLDCCPQLAGHKAAYTKDRRMKAAKGTPIYECNFMCSCRSSCYNRVVQFGRQFPVCVFRTGNGRGWGVKTCSYLKRGTFVTEYVGEVITTEEAERRGVTYDREGSTYLFDLDFDEDHPEFTIDAGHCGNISHFFNHSCSPNLQVFSVWINTLDTRLPQLGLFAKKDIGAGEELTFDYQMSHNMAGHNRGEGRVPCLCGSSKCRGFLI